MDDPTHVNENRFWDQVADWVVESRDWDDGDIGEADLEAMLRDLRDHLDPY